MSGHRKAAKLRKEKPTDHLIILFDEIEAHLHPRWQRLFLPTLIDVLGGDGAVSNRQLLVATHSPLVTASMETKFDETLVRLFAFELKGSTVSAMEIPWARQGDVVNWLVSDSFGLRQARSKDAEVGGRFFRSLRLHGDVHARQKIGDRISTGN